ncbi:acetolactate synthase large subunit [Alsobacter sp. R-9]
MNGADLLCDTLLANGVDVCFANPGTSEMHFVAALDRKPRMRCVLGLFEGVVTGAADGYGRMTDRPAATLLHTGPGLANGLANLHNARRARTPMVNVVGDHASWHLVNDAPLTSDIEGLARPMSHFVRRIAGSQDVQRATEECIAASLHAPGITTLILPADAAWGAVDPTTPAPIAALGPDLVLPGAVESAARVIRDALAAGRKVTLLLAGKALRAATVTVAGRIAAATGVRLLSPMSSPRIERGAGRIALAKVPYPVDQSLPQLADIDLLVLAGAPVPVAFFGYPGKPGRLVRDDCEVVTLAEPTQDAPAAVAALAEALGVPAGAASLPAVAAAERPGVPSGALTPERLAAVVGALLPEGAILVDESITASGHVFAATRAAPQHDYLQITGGSIGIGIPLAAGAAVACPERKVVAVQADGSAMYTIQGLWTQARENLDIVTVIVANRTYAILNGEMRGVGVNEVGVNARRMLNLDDPVLDFVGIARGLGVEAARATTAEDLADLLRGAMGRRGPFLIEAVV